MWLFRPDGYTACVAKNENGQALARYLQDLEAPAAGACARRSVFCLGMAYSSGVA
jgi:hypothetical protein